jgi:hypothetical protein
VKRLKAGPELKMPDLKMPQFLVDLYWDLRDRRLLPLLGLVLMAIVAVPFLLGGSSDQPAAPAAPSTGAPSPEPAAGASGARLTVVQAQPGLRDYHKRLGDDSPTNPFKQRFTGPVLKGTKLGGGGEASTSTSTSTVTTTTGGGGGGSSSTSPSTVTTTTGGGSGSSGGGEAAPGSSSPGSPPETLPGGGQAPNPGELVYYSNAIDVQITRTATKENGEKETSGPTVHKRVLPYSALPSEKVPVVVYLGPNPNTHLPMLLVSEAVTSIFGETKCLSGDETCQLLEVETGLPVNFTYGPNLDRYKINVLKIYRVVVDRTKAGRRARSQYFSK